METKAWDAVVIGAGISGLEVANRLGKLGYEVLLVEKEKELGGHARQYNCKALQDLCTKCNACLVNDRIKEVLSNKKVVLMVSCTLEKVERDQGRLMLTLRKNGNIAYAYSRCIIFCHGFKMFDPLKQKNLAYGKSPNIITALEAEKIIKHRGKLLRPSDNAEPKTLCFIQCVGSRNKEHNYCSQVCCGYAIRIAQLVKLLQPDIQITFFYMDIQTFSRDFANKFHEIKGQFEFIRQIPGELFPNNDGTISLYAKVNNKIEEMTFDLVILSSGITPQEDPVNLEALGCMKDKDGFLRFKSQEGIFALGTSRGPMSISDCVLDVTSKLPEIVSYLEASNG